MAKTKQKNEYIVQQKGMPIFTGINKKYQPIPRFESGCKNC